MPQPPQRGDEGSGLPAASLPVVVHVRVQRSTERDLLKQERRREVQVGLALLGGAARASTFVLVALYLQQALAMAPKQVGLAMVPTSLTGFAVSLTLLPRIVRNVGPSAPSSPDSSSSRPATCGWRMRRRPPVTVSASCRDCSSSPSAWRSASLPRRWSSRPPCRIHTAGSRRAWPGRPLRSGQRSVPQPSRRSASPSAGGTVGIGFDSSGFSAAFTAAAAVALTPPRSEPRSPRDDADSTARQVVAGPPQERSQGLSPAIERSTLRHMRNVPYRLSAALQDEPPGPPTLS